MVSLETEADRTLFFDLLPLDIGVIGGMKVRLQLYTVPGQVFYNATRRLVLKGVDGIVFVADSQVPAAEPNEESLANLRQNLEELGVEPRIVPLVVQYNKRDLRNILPLDKLQQSLNPGGAPAFEAAAVHGVGVFETLKEISRLSLASIRSKIAEQKRSGVAGIERRVPASLPAPAPAAAAPAALAAESKVFLAVSAVQTGDTGKLATDPSLLEPLQVEFAEEDTDKHQLRAVKMRGKLDLGQELEKLRALTADAKLKPPTAVKDREVDKLFKELVPGARDGDQEISRKISLEVPEHLLRGLTDLRIHLGFDRNGREEVQRDAVRVTLVRTRKLQRLRLRLDLELKSKE
jgi:signal recognition particle receptor subunit beta